MFTNDNKVHNDVNEIILKDIASVELKLLIDSCYSGKIQLTNHNVDKVLAAASHLRFVNVVEACVKFLKTVLSPRTALGIHRLAERHGLMDLSGVAVRKISKHFDEISQGDEFRKMSCAQLTVILSNDGIKTGSAMEVFEAIMQWMEFDKDNRNDFLLELLGSVRVSSLSSEVN